MYNNTKCNELKERTMYDNNFICKLPSRLFKTLPVTAAKRESLAVERASLALYKIIEEWRSPRKEDKIPERYNLSSIFGIRYWGNDPEVVRDALNAPKELLENDDFFGVLSRVLANSNLSEDIRKKLLTTFPQQQDYLNKMFSAMDQYPINGGRSRKAYRYKRKIMKNYRRRTRRKKNTK